MDTYKLVYTEALIKKGVRAYWRKQVGIAYPLVAVGLTGYFFYLLESGYRSWPLGVIGLVAFLSFALIVAIYIIHLRSSMTAFDKMTDQQGEIGLSGDRIKLSSEVGTTEIRWSFIRRIFRFDAFWVIEFDGSGFVILPLDNLPESARSFIEAKVTEHRGVVI